ncbi:IclR family transcriptional regulator [Paenibacillus sp. GCM10023248]|uniref:IclR family transcriptional regulator n=1 Tax=Bacillales TaxID=1385 RepID=UPI002379D43A|nr:MULTISPECIES: IclR family transcriptional regulator [Bacillales]MDD9269122.1 IclR family transcriptional regulator [Paenibacillus sp. MAHUQ-63]MDR6880657.1 DNA-binding IclR family transcriptional regulator [Bacillus sp. 3255]
MPIIQALDRALRIMDLFDEYTTELKITEISARMELHKSTVHALLKTLQLHGYIHQDTDTGKYKLGLKLLEKGQLMLQGLDIRTVARKHLEALSETTGQTAHLVILDGREGVYLDKVEGAKAAIRYSRIGRRVSLHSSAVGKVLAAYRTPNERDALLRDYHFSKYTEATITGREAFMNELDQVRELGYAVDNQENEPGVRCGAAPIFEHNGSIAAAISISTLVVTVDDHLFGQYISLLKKEADMISQTLGFRRV